VVLELKQALSILGQGRKTNYPVYSQSLIDRCLNRKLPCAKSGAPNATIESDDSMAVLLFWFQEIIGADAILVNDSG